MAKNDKTTDPTDFGPDVHPINVDGKYYSPEAFKAEVLPLHPGRWPNCGAAQCKMCSLTYVSFGNGCTRCGSMRVKEL